MVLLKNLLEEPVSFPALNRLIENFRSGNYDLLFIKQVTSRLGVAIIITLIILEIIHALLLKKWKFKEYKTILIIFIFNRLIYRILSISVVLFCIGAFQKFALLKTGLTWYWLIYGYTIWELANYIYHFMAHKVRLFWCLHATHHSPDYMNLSLQYAHFIFEGPFSDLIRIPICVLLGINPVLLFLILFIDSIWATCIHVGENLVKNGRFGFLGKIILTPSHHRVHHARNPLYMDTNFCSLLNIWDRVFKTYQIEHKEIPPQYGITREINTQSFTDMYFGEFVALGRDMYHAPGIKYKLLYMVMPPGWSHTGEHKTAKKLREAFIKNQTILTPQIT